MMDLFNMFQESSGDIFQWLRGFYYVATTGSFSKAAIEMGRSQSTITIQIQKLENEFGLKLLERSPAKVTLTYEGEMFLKKILLIFETIKELRYLSQNEPSDLEGEISIATTHSILQYYLPQVISDFKKNHPKIRIRISGSFNHEILRKLDLSDADFGLCSPVSSHTSYTCLKLFETKFALIVNKNENLPFKKEAITLDQISKKTFIHYNRDSFLRKIIESKFIERGLHIQIPIEVNHFETIKRYVELGLGISIINSICLSQTDISRFKIIPMDEFFAKRTYYLIFRKGKYISPPASKLIQLITSTT